MGMQLPVPVDQAMNDALYDITGGSFYLGISDETVEDDFRNIYTDTTITFANWDRVSIAALLQPTPFMNLCPRRLFESQGEPNNVKFEGHSIFGKGEDYVVYMNNPKFEGQRKLWNDVPKYIISRTCSLITDLCSVQF